MGHRNFMPGKYRGVSVTEVDFQLDEARLRAHFLGREAYRRTRFIVVRHGEQAAVLQVAKASADDLFSPITSVELLAGPADCSYVVARDVDTGVPTQVAAAARRLAPEVRCAIVQGRYEHVNFMLEPCPVRLTVVEVVPPEPPKLIDQVTRVLAMAEDLPPVELEPVVFDLRELAGRKSADAYLFPCRGSGLTRDGAFVSYLDERPESRPWVLVGCARSREIHNWFYGFDAEFVDMCPRNLAAGGCQRHGFPGPTASRGDSPLRTGGCRRPGSPGTTASRGDSPLRTGLSGSILTKCCLFEDRVEMDGEATIVPWGATLAQVREGLAGLLQKAEPSWSPA